MLILLLRLIFVLLATGAGHNSGMYFYRTVFDGAMPTWFGGVIGFSIAVTLIAAEQGFRRRFSRSLVAFLGGLGIGLLLSLLLVAVLHLVIQDRDLSNNLDAPLTLITTYLVLVTVLSNVDRWRVVLPFVELRSERQEGGMLVLDGAILGDGRLPGLLRSGFPAHRVLIHRSALARWEADLSSAEEAKAKRAQRALEVLAELRAQAMPMVEVDESEIPNSADPADLTLRLARLENARLFTADREMVRRAAAEGVPVVDIHSLTQLLSPTVRVGETLTVTILRAGEAKGQGVGQLDDGSLVIVNNANDKIGQSIPVVVLRTHATSSGRMVFADPV
jgi:uncharacterized protein YacL